VIKVMDMGTPSFSWLLFAFQCWRWASGPGKPHLSWEWQGQA
jgi:hypothetical protein